MMKYKLQDLIDIDHFQNLQDRLNKIYSFPSSIIDNEGNILTATAWQDVCTKFHRKNKKCERACIKSDQYILDHLHEANPAVTYRCPHGLVDNATPIIIDGIHYGNFFTGQFFLETPDLDHFKAQAKKYGFQEKAYIEAVKRVPVWTQEELDNYLFFIKGLIAVISECGLKTLKEIENRKIVEMHEERHRSILETITDGVILQSASGEITTWNKGAEEIFGISSKDTVGQTSEGKAWPTIRQDGSPYLGHDHPSMKTLRTGQPSRNEIMGVCHPSGQVRWISINTNPLYRANEAKPDAVVISFSDITALKNEKDQTEMFLDATTDGIWTWNFKTNKLFFSPKSYKMLGYAPGAFPADYEHWLELIHPDDREKALAVAKEYLRTKPDHYKNAFRLLTSDGDYQWIQAQARVVERDDNGEAVLMVGNHENITERKLAEKALQESEEKFRLLFENSADAHVLYAIDRFIDCNYSCLNMLGITKKEQLLSMHPADISPPYQKDGKPSKEAAESIIALAFEKGSHRFDWLCQRSDGTELILDVLLNVIKIQGKDIIHGVLRDITDKKRADNALRESERKYRDLVDTMPYGIEEIDLNGRSVFLNDAYHHMLGYKPGELVGTSIWDRDPTEESAKKVKAYFDFIKNEKPKPEPYISKNLRKDGTIIDVNVDWNYKFDESGELKGFIAVVTDITDKIQSERALKESEFRFRSFVENANDIVYAVSPEGLFTYVSPNWLEFMGEPADDAIGKSFIPYLHPDDVHLCQQFLAKVLTSGQKQSSVEYRVKHKDGSLRWQVSNGSPMKDLDGNITGYVGIARDVTEKKKIVNELRESEEKFSKAFQSAPLLMTITSIDDGRFVDVNDAFVSLTGYSREAAIGSRSTEIGFALLEERNRMLDILKTKGRVKDLELKVNRADGSQMVCLYSAETFNLKGQKCLLSTAIDISERKQAEEALRESEDFLNQTGDMAQVGGWEVDLDTMKVVWTQTTGRIHELPHGYFPDLEEAISYYHPEDQDHVRQCVQRAIESSEPFDFTVRLITAKGRQRWVRALGQPIFESGSCIRLSGTFQDITERLKLEEELRQAQKMETIGNLAGGIAHDFNNILFPIIGMSEMLIEDLPPKSIERENAEEIYKAGIRGSDLVKQILAFSRQSEHKKMPTRIQNVLKEVTKLSRSTIPTYIEIKQDIQQDCGIVLADPSQIHQIGMNIITNAYHAVEDTGGTISIKLKQTATRAPESAEKIFSPKSYAVLSISDNGHGMSEELIEKIFDPYFTTKEKGKGTGLGLAMVYGIVKEHGGDIRVYSKIGRGSTFEIYFPLMDKLQSTESTPEIGEYQGGKERILLVDDEEPVAKLEKQMLERLGYMVTMRVNSLEALEEFKAKPDVFDMVISDMTMPNMTGDQLAKALISIRPAIPIIICTGFSERLNQETAAGIGVKGFLMKPIIKSELAKKVRKVLDETKGETQG